MNRRVGFTLVELLVVMAIIAILMTIFIPQVSTALVAARAAGCRTQMNQILTASASFSADHKGLMPSAWSHSPNTSNGWQMCFIGQEIIPDNVSLSTEWPKNRFGSLVDYLGGDLAARQLVRCPGLKTGPLRSGIGSNGFFDYVMFEVFSGCKASDIPSRAKVNFGTGIEDVPCPWLTEEDPSFFLNAGFIQPFHKSTDRMGSWHNGKGHAGTADGAVVAYTAKREVGGRLVLPEATEWRAVTPRGKDRALSQTFAFSTPTSWGWWARE